MINFFGNIHFIYWITFICTVSCLLVLRSFPLLLSWHAIQTLICLNEQLLQWKILAPFKYFELNLHLHKPHCQFGCTCAQSFSGSPPCCVPHLPPTKQSWKTQAILMLLLILWKGSSDLYCSRPSHSSLILRSDIGKCGAGHFFQPLRLNGVGSLVASTVQISGSCSFLCLNSTDSVFLVALSSDVSLDSSCLRLPNTLLADPPLLHIPLGLLHHPKGLKE